MNFMLTVLLKVSSLTDFSKVKHMLNIIDCERNRIHSLNWFIRYFLNRDFVIWYSEHIEIEINTKLLDKREVCDKYQWKKE
jgi:hypothetical protein